MKRILFLLAIVSVCWSCGKEDPPEPVIMFSSDFEGKFAFVFNSNLFTLDQTGIIQLTHDQDAGTSNKGGAKWINNGNGILYLETFTCFFCPAGYLFNLVKSDGSDPKSIWDLFGLSWINESISHDLKHAAITRATTTLTDSIINRTFIYSVDDTLHASLIDSVDGANRAPQWSPGSDRIAFTSEDGTSGELAIYNILTREKTSLFTYNDLNAGVIAYDWSYQGDKIAFIWNKDIYVVNSDGSNMQNLTSSPNFENHVAWSKTSDVLAYTQYTQDLEKSRIIVHDFADQSQTFLDSVQRKNATITQIQWSADNKTIAFQYCCDLSGIFLIDRDGSNLRQIYDKSVTGFDWYSE